MLPNLEIILRLVVATILGSLIGLERERLNWTAGLRTHMLVCVGAALFMIVSAFGFADILGTANVNLDPSRVAAQVASGIGFLGAGTIILRRQIVRGLTTAASLWTVAAVGLAVGGGLYVAAITATALVLIILAGIKPLEQRFFRQRQTRQITLVMNPRELSLLAIEQTLETANLTLREMLIQHSDTPGEDHLLIRLKAPRRKSVHAAVEQLRQLPGVRAISHTYS